MIPPTLPHGPRPVPLLTAVAPAPDSVLLLTWKDGRTDRVDLSGWLEAGHPDFRRLGAPDLFATATLMDDTTVAWGGGDLAIDSTNLALLAEQQRALRPAEPGAMTDSVDRIMQGLQEAAAYARGDDVPGMVLHVPRTVDEDTPAARPQPNS